MNGFGTKQKNGQFAENTANNLCTVPNKCERSMSPACQKKERRLPPRIWLQKIHLTTYINCSKIRMY